MTPRGYDPLELHHWLCWEHLCTTATFEGFQRLFEDVMTRVRRGFMRIRSYGNIGDRKCDGWLESEGTVFQVYSPDECRQVETQAKIEEDLAGAVNDWREKGMRRWVFVYNVRRGVPPDISATLSQQRKKHPWLTIEHVSNDDLWEMVRTLPLQKRVEILGPPPGFEYLFLTPEGTSEEVLERLRFGRFVVVHDVLSPIDVHSVLDALKPEQPLGPPLRIRPELAPGGWEDAAREQQAIVEDALAKSEQLRPRFAVFSLSPIPLLVHLGYLFSDRVEVALFQFDRERRSWSWQEQLAASADLNIEAAGIPEQVVEGSAEVVLRVSLSARISPRDTAPLVPEDAIQVDIRVADPTVMWLRSPDQLLALGRKVREVLQRLTETVPGCKRIHLFYAGPAGGAIVAGQAINPRMNPPVALYEYHRQRDPRFEHVLTLADPGRR